jgi:hypothetical protein
MSRLSILLIVISVIASDALGTEQTTFASKCATTYPNARIRVLLRCVGMEADGIVTF